MNSVLAFDEVNNIFRFKSALKDKHLQHLVTGRHTLANKDFNLSFHTGNQQQVLEHRSALSTFFKESKGLVIPQQCHGVRVKKITLNNCCDNALDTDALITNEPRIVLGVLSADCVPVLLYDPVLKAIGLIHAGWKGTVAEIVVRTLEEMVRHYGSAPSVIRAFIGPSISQERFEVGEEVVSHFMNLGLEACIKKDSVNKARIDLWKANQLLMQKAGILEENILIAGICTQGCSEHFYSARKEGFATGRFGLFGMLS